MAHFARLERVKGGSQGMVWLGFKSLNANDFHQIVLRRKGLLLLISNRYVNFSGTIVGHDGTLSYTYVRNQFNVSLLYVNPLC